MKGKWWFALIAVATGWVGIGLGFGLVGAIRLAKPYSYWARRKYGEQKMAKAMLEFGGKGGRFPGSTPSEAESAVAEGLAAAARVSLAKAEARTGKTKQEALKLTQS